MVLPAGKTPTPTPSGQGTYNPAQRSLVLGLKQPEDAVNKTAIAAGRTKANTATSARQAAANLPLSNPPLSALSETTFTDGSDIVGLRRGVMVRKAVSAAGGNLDRPFVFRFLYNPATIDLSTSTFAGVLPPQYTPVGAERYTAHFAGQEQLNFQLMLDRTQEFYEQGLGCRGTQIDIDALYRVLNGPAGNPGYLTLSAVEVQWGPTSQNGRPLPSFFGYVTNLHISHTMLSPRMAPMRSIVDITVNSLVTGELHNGVVINPLGVS